MRLKDELDRLLSVVTNTKPLPLQVVARCIWNIHVCRVPKTELLQRLYGLRWRTVDRCASAEKVHNRKMLYMTLTFKAITLKMSSCLVNLVSKCDKFVHALRRQVKMSPIVLIWWYAVSLWHRPLTFDLKV